MDRDAVIKRLKDAEPVLRARGVDHIALFGSLARGEQGPGSDIDLLVDLDPAAQIGLFAYTAIVNDIQDLFSDRVDVADRQALRSYVRPNAEREAIYAF